MRLKIKKTCFHDAKSLELHWTHFAFSFLTLSPYSMDFAPLRHYLNGPVRPSARDVMSDALIFMFPGAIHLSIHLVHWSSRFEFMQFMKERITFSSNGFKYHIMIFCLSGMIHMSNSCNFDHT